MRTSKGFNVEAGFGLGKYLRGKTIGRRSRLWFGFDKDAQPILCAAWGNETPDILKANIGHLRVSATQNGAVPDLANATEFPEFEHLSKNLKLLWNLQEELPEQIVEEPEIRRELIRHHVRLLARLMLVDDSPVSVVRVLREFTEIACSDAADITAGPAPVLGGLQGLKGRIDKRLDKMEKVKQLLQVGSRKISVTSGTQEGREDCPALFIQYPQR